MRYINKRNVVAKIVPPSPMLPNAQSSRPHCLVYIQLVNADGCVSQLVLVDLAGAEKAKRTNANQERLKEAGIRHED